MKKNTDISFLNTKSRKVLLFVNIILLLVYFSTITFWFEVSNPTLFILLILGQVFYLWQGISHTHTIWETDHITKPANPTCPSDPVDIFITVAGEPLEVVRETVLAAKAIDYPNFTVHILNDGYVAKKDNWKEIETLALELGVNCITRTIPGGAKAGNINNAIGVTNAPFVVIFDADHVPEPHFLQKTMPHMNDEKMGFVQSPQYYKNSSTNLTTAGAWEQQQLFFGAICKGKNRYNSATMCGTNMVIRREALSQVGNICEWNIAEDFITGMFIHEKGWKSVYVPEILAKGLAPEDFMSYYKQQLRWAKGSLEVLFKFNPLLRKGLSFSQKIQYLSSASYYLSGVVVLLNAIIPLIYFFTGYVPFSSSTMALVAAFMPYMLLTIYNLQISSNHTYTFRALKFSMASFWIHATACVETIIGKVRGFSITSKVRVDGNFPSLVIPNILYVLIAISGFAFALFRDGITPSLVTNTIWAFFYVLTFSIFIKAAIPEPKKLLSESLVKGKRVYGKIFRLKTTTNVSSAE